MKEQFNWNAVGAESGEDEAREALEYGRTAATQVAQLAEHLRHESDIDLSDEDIVLMTDDVEHWMNAASATSLMLALEQSSTVRSNAGDSYTVYVSESDSGGYTVCVCKGMMPPHKWVEVDTVLGVIEQCAAWGVALDAQWVPLDDNGDPIKDVDDGNVVYRVICTNGDSTQVYDSFQDANGETIAFEAIGESPTAQEIALLPPGQDTSDFIIYEVKVVKSQYRRLALAMDDDDNVVMYTVLRGVAE